jgi:predicted TIM-barrel fold metal-dependent hydrolase
MTYLGPIIDPHMHLWDLERHYYGWLQDSPAAEQPGRRHVADRLSLLWAR